MSAHIEARLRMLARLAAVTAGLIALLALAGWMFDLPRLRSLLPGAIGMRPNAVVAALLLATGLLLLSREGIGAWRRRLVQAGALLVAILAGVSLLEYLLGWEAGIDRVLFRQALGEFERYGGRIAALAAFDYLLLAAALMLAVSGREWARRAGQGAALVGAAVSLLSLLGYTFHFASLYTLSPHASQSLPSALACFLLSLGVLLTWPGRGWMRVLASKHAGGALLRLALPLVLGLTWLLSWLSVAGARAGLYTLEVDQVFLALPLMLVFCLFFFVMAAVLNRAGEQQQGQREEVERLNQELEARVERRTTELAQTISALEREVEERKEAEQQLRTASLYTRTLIEASVDPLVTISKDGQIMDVNRATEEVTGVAREKLIGGDFCDYFTEPERARAGYEQVFATGRVQDYPLAIRHTSGRLTEVLYNATVFQNERGQVEGVFAAARDVTERKHAEQEVHRLNAELEERVRQRTAELEESNRELESFTYSVSHDLRAPLRHVDGFSKILLEEYGSKLDEGGRTYLERVRRGTQFMGRLVDDLLNLSRVGRQALAVQITGLGSLVAEARKELAVELEGREVEWRIGDLPFVECDAGLMKQVLANLLSNALKFTRPRPRAVIEVGRQPGDGAPVIFVRDNGVGLHMKYADKLFGIFQRLHRQEDFEGTGVGLATVARILHKHGGRAWAEAELDKGATFYFTLGAAEASAERPPAQEVAA